MSKASTNGRGTVRRKLKPARVAPEELERRLHDAGDEYDGWRSQVPPVSYVYDWGEPAEARLHCVIKALNLAGIKATTDRVAALVGKHPNTVRTLLTDLRAWPAMEGGYAVRSVPGRRWAARIPSSFHWVRVPPQVLFHPTIGDGSLALWAHVWRLQQKPLGYCYGTASALASVMGVSFRYSQKVRARMVEAGLLEIEIEGHKIGPNKFLNKYRALLPDLVSDLSR